MTNGKKRRGRKSFSLPFLHWSFELKIQSGWNEAATLTFKKPSGVWNLIRPPALYSTTRITSPTSPLMLCRKTNKMKSNLPDAAEINLRRKHLLRASYMAAIIPFLSSVALNCSWTKKEGEKKLQIWSLDHLSFLSKHASHQRTTFTSHNPPLRKRGPLP